MRAPCGKPEPDRMPRCAIRSNEPPPRPRGRGSGAPDRIRTCDLWLRRPTLYPAELRARERQGYAASPRRVYAQPARPEACALWEFWPRNAPNRGVNKLSDPACLITIDSLRTAHMPRPGRIVRAGRTDPPRLPLPRGASVAGSGRCRPGRPRMPVSRRLAAAATRLRRRAAPRAAMRGAPTGSGWRGGWRRTRPRIPRGLRIRGPRR